MPRDSDPSGTPPSARRAVLVTAGVGSVLLFVAVLADRAHTRELRTQAREDVTQVLQGYAAAVELAVAEYAVLVEGLAAWMREYPDADADAFAEYSAILDRTTPDALALNRVRGTTIENVYPLDRNRAAIGIDLETHTEPESYRGLLRARETGQVSISEPLSLAQGGRGVILFRTGGVGADGLPLAAQVVVSLPTLLDGTDLEGLAEAFRVHVSTVAGATILGDPLDPGVNPVTASVELPDGAWQIAAVPGAGWASMAEGRSLAFRTSLLVILALLGVLTWTIAGRDERLTRAVEERTTALQRANADLEAQREMRNAAMSAGGVVVWVWDMERNDIDRTGSIRQSLGRPLHESLDDYLERVHPEDVDTVRAALAEARETGVMSSEFRERGIDGGWVWLRVEGRATETEGDRPLRMLGASADITTVKRLEAELLHQDRVELIGQLAGGVVHDINNALTVVLGDLDNLQDETEGTDNGDAIGEALSAARYASVLTGQLLTFARKDEVRPTVFEWDALCRETGSFIQRILGHRVHLESEFSAEGGRVRMDRTQAMQMLVNLATNARDAIENGGVLELRTDTVEDAATVDSGLPAGPAVVTEVTDSGPGIPEEIRAHIFEPFFTTKGKERGTGLGLSTTHRIATEAGGTVTFESSPAGTTFRITLPLVPQRAA